MSKQNKIKILVAGCIFTVALLAVSSHYLHGKLTFRADVTPPPANSTASVTYIDGNGNTQTVASNPVSLIIDSTPDTIPPVIDITSPSSYATISGNTNITVVASDDRTLSLVKLKIDETDLLSQSTSPLSFNLNTTLYKNGVHTLTALALDASSNSATRTITVTINNATPPPSSPISLNLTIAKRIAGCPTLSGTITITPVGSMTPLINNDAVLLDTSCNVTYSPAVAITSGQYNIILDFDTLLKKTLNTISLPSVSTISAGSFIQGDITNNDCIDTSDWGALFSKWNLIPTSAGWDSKYDLKGDNNQIGMEDWGVMYFNWNQGSNCGI